ncbi:hypothetical protein [Nitrosomonas sp.]|uniref:hypothetical protein n=1 Tax=Nitrosomonas sp. TaxID=42353 RepID=UPI0025F9F9FE|nr:hypothetical protein [Nitrosomonas sp.]
MKNIAKLAIISSVSVSLAACATSGLAPVPTISGDPQRVVERNYKLNSTTQKYVGESIVKVKDYYAKKVTKPVVIATEDFTMSGSNLNGTGMSATLRATKGEELAIAGSVTHEGRDYYVVRLPANSPCNPPCPLVDPASGQLISKAWFYTGYFTPGDGYTEITPPTVRLLRGESESVESSRGYLNQELVYSGLSGSTIRLAYREYTPDDMARPSFFQDLTYDQGVDIIVRFKNIRIKVHQATNESISYTVLEDGLP